MLRVDRHHRSAIVNLKLSLTKTRSDDARIAARPDTVAEPASRRGSGRLGERLALPAIWVVTAVLFATLPQTSHLFVSLDMLGTIGGTGAVTAVLALGLIIPMTAGDYDLSVAANLELSSMLTAILNVDMHLNIALCILIVLVIGTLIGAINGAVTVLSGIDPFIVTLGTATVIDGVVLWTSHQNTIAGVSPGLSNLVIGDSFLGLPLVFYFAVILAAVLSLVLNNLPVGRRLLYVGLGKEVARLSGVADRRVRFGALTIAGTVSAVAGVLYVGMSGAADPTSGTTLLLPAYAAVMLGATTIIPGRFNPWGCLVAVYFLGTGITGMQLLGAQSYVQDLFYGTALVLAVVLSQLVRRRRRAADETAA
jgi:ribose transport system permease protein